MYSIRPRIFCTIYKRPPPICANCEIELFADDAKAIKLPETPKTVMCDNRILQLCNWANIGLLTLSLKKQLKSK